MNGRTGREPDIQKIDWLLPILKLDTVKQAYGVIRRKQIPDDCVIRIGNKIRINADKVRAWLNGEPAEQSLPDR
jgi:hypothetical protein